MPFLNRAKAAIKAFIHPAAIQSLPPTPVIQCPAEIQLVEPGQLLQGKTVLITGAGRNIGRAIALECASQGATVYFIELDKTLCYQLEQTLAEMGNSGQGFLCDITQQAQIDQVCQQLQTMQIQIDVLINNVGIHLPTSAYHLDPQEWQQTYQTNVFGPVYLSHLISRSMVKQKTAGSLIFISSIHQWVPVGCAGYSSSKAAIGGIIQELAIELAPYNIRVNGIAPGWASVDEDGRPRLDQRGQLHQTTIPPQYIGRAAVYLSANYFSQYTTGTVLKVDSGLSLMHRTVPIFQEIPHHVETDPIAAPTKNPVPATAMA
jgi:NAD(P)-dependent dehydrogenase (short-subunit alcohol dehydrogenase family)